MNAFNINSKSSNSSWSSPSYRTLLRSAFSMVELLVVIAIISVLVGLLLVALKGAKVRAEVTKTSTTMQSFSSACDAFQFEHGQYPGVIPENILAADPAISGTENALLHLMGGYRVISPWDGPASAAVMDYDNFGNGDSIIEHTFGNSGWKLKVDLLRIGEGPLINGTLYSPYFTPKGDEFAVTKGQFYVGFNGMNSRGVPDLIDAWGQPIVYVKRSRPIGPLALDSDQDVPPQFLYGTMIPYLESPGLGEFGKDQTNNTNGSIFNHADNPTATFAQILRHAAFGEPDEPLKGNSQGAYILFSAGPDGIYFSIADGPGTSVNPVYNIVDDDDYGNPLVVNEYDDIRIFGGG